MARIVAANESVSLDQFGRHADITVDYRGAIAKVVSYLADWAGPVVATGVIDVGDPNDPVFLRSTLTTPERNAIADAFGADRATLPNGSTWWDAVLWLRDAGSDLRFDVGPAWNRSLFNVWSWQLSSSPLYAGEVV